MINPYAYVRQFDGVTCDLKEETNLWLHYAIDFPSAQAGQYWGNNKVKGDYYFPRKINQAPLVILVHGMGDRSVVPCRLMAHSLAKKGIASFILYLIFHKCRIPASIRAKYPSLTAGEWLESYQISVTDIRQVVDWASSRPEINPDQISSVGISFGGFVSSIAMALDKRIKAGVLVVSGGNSDKITRYGWLLRRQYKHNEAEFSHNQESYFQYIAEVEEKGFENVIPGKSSYLTDPLTFSGYIRQRPLLMLNALWDEMIPKVATLDLWKAFGKPPIAWYPATHASIWLWYPLISSKICGFLKAALNTPASSI